MNEVYVRPGFPLVPRVLNYIGIYTYMLFVYLQFQGRILGEGVTGPVFPLAGIFGSGETSINLFFYFCSIEFWSCFAIQKKKKKGRYDFLGSNSTRTNLVTKKLALKNFKNDFSERSSYYARTILTTYNLSPSPIPVWWHGRFIGLPPHPSYVG